jgi:hypothetical protein
VHTCGCRTRVAGWRWMAGRGLGSAAPPVAPPTHHPRAHPRPRAHLVPQPLHGKTVVCGLRGQRGWREGWVWSGCGGSKGGPKAGQKRTKGRPKARWGFSAALVAPLGIPHAHVGHPWAHMGWLKRRLGQWVLIPRLLLSAQPAWRACPRWSRWPWGVPRRTGAARWGCAPLGPSHAPARANKRRRAGHV